MPLARPIFCAVAVATLTVAAAPALAEERFFLVRLPDDSMVTVRVDVAEDLPMKRVPGLPGEPLDEVGGRVPGTELLDIPRPEATNDPRGRGEPRRDGSDAGGARPQTGARSKEPARRRAGRRHGDRAGRHRSRRRGDRSFFDGLPGPSRHGSDLAIRRYRVPIFLLPIYQAAGNRYGVRWHVLAAINEIETDYGRNVNVSSAGAVGWMQFMPATWRAYGVDANRDGRRDPYNPVDAIFAAARYLQASGYAHDVRRAIFAYNHAGWYVDSVLLRARLIAGIAGRLGGSLSGLTEGRFPVAARTFYARDFSEGRGRPHRSVELFARRGSRVVAVSDGVVKQIGRTPRLGRFVVLADVNGNRYTYAGLATAARVYPWPREPWTELRARGGGPQRAPRLFAHPFRPDPRRAGGLEQVLDARAVARGLEVYTNPFLRGFGTNAHNARLKWLRRGSHVLEGTVIGKVGRPRPHRAAHIRFGIRPAGRHAQAIDPKPILDGWRLLESTALYRVPGSDALGEPASLRRLLVMPNELLERRVLADSRIAIYPCGRQDIRAGRIDRRVLTTLSYLADSGLRPTVTSLRCGHSYYTSSGNVSHHSAGSAVDIAMLNGVPVLGHQRRGGITERAVRRLKALRGQMRPAQIISLLALGGNTMSMGDHDDHIHVGFGPGPRRGGRIARHANAILGPGQWEDLVERLGRIRNPRVGPRRAGS